MRPVTDSAGDWLNGRQAAKIIGCSPTAVIRLALLGQIKARLEPGVSPRYDRRDVETVAKARRVRRQAQPQAAGA
jgi:hypothetical protein